MAKAMESPARRYATAERAGTGRAPARPARGALSAMYARMLEGAGITVNGPSAWDMQVADDRLWRRLAVGGTLALGEAYADGWWDAPRLDEFFARLIRARVDERALNLTRAAAGVAALIRNLQVGARARRVAEVHYDLDGRLYAAMLGPSMVYSCGYWRYASSLDEAQEHKLDLVCRKLGLERGMRLLDIGCGWGSLARYAATRYGVEVVGVTISETQAEHARDACRGLPVEIRLQDYRELREEDVGRFDRVASIGMFEHVGRKNYGTFMTRARELVVDDGLVLLHTIGRPVSGAGVDPWVTRYIFPNSEVPTLARLTGAIDRVMNLEDWHNFGSDYDPTLMAWYDNFIAAWPRFEQQFGLRFKRVWTYYLMMFAGVFRARGLDVWQLVLSPLGATPPYRRPLF